MAKRTSINYIDGIYLPGHLVTYRQRFKKFGKTLMVKNTARSVLDLNKDTRMAGDLVKAGMTVAQLISAACKDEWRKPTPDEVKEFEAADKKAQEYLAKARKGREADKQRGLEHDILLALRLLRKHGAISDSGRFQSPPACGRGYHNQVAKLLPGRDC